MLALSTINILVCLNRLKYKKYALLLFSDADKAFMLIWIHVAAIFYVLYALIGFYLQIKYHIDWDTSDYTRYFYSYFGGDNNI